MTDTTAPEPGLTGDAPARARLPWASLLVLGAASFVMVTAEMLPTAVLPEMSAGLGVTESQTGLLVSLWAGVVVVASLPLVRLTRGADRRAVIVWSLVALAASVAVTAFAPTYAIAVGGRLAGALAVGLLWATANAYTADLVPDRDLARAVAVVLGGATLGTVIGTPLGSLVAQEIGWRAAFGGLALAALIAAALVRAVVRRPPIRPDASAGAEVEAEAEVESETQVAVQPSETPVGATAEARTSSGAGGLAAMSGIVALVALLLVGHYGAYTFITRLVEAPAGAVPGGVGGMLLVFGAASWVGIVLAGRFGERTGRAFVVSAAVTALAVAALGVVAVHPVVGIAVVIVWGTASGALPALAQTMILRLAGPGRRALAGALIPVVFNLGIAIGAAVAAVAVSAGGVAVLPPLGAAVIAVAAVGLAIVTVRGATRTAGASARVSRGSRGPLAHEPAPRCRGVGALPPARRPDRPEQGT